MIEPYPHYDSRALLDGCELSKFYLLGKAGDRLLVAVSSRKPSTAKARNQKEERQSQNRYNRNLSSRCRHKIANGGFAAGLSRSRPSPRPVLLLPDDHHLLSLSHLASCSPNLKSRQRRNKEKEKQRQRCHKARVKREPSREQHLEKADQIEEDPVAVALFLKELCRG